MIYYTTIITYLEDKEKIHLKLVNKLWNDVIKRQFKKKIKLYLTVNSHKKRSYIVSNKVKDSISIMLKGSTEEKDIASNFRQIFKLLPNLSTISLYLRLSGEDIGVLENLYVSLFVQESNNLNIKDLLLEGFRIDEDIARKISCGFCKLENISLNSMISTNEKVLKPIISGFKELKSFDLHIAKIKGDDFDKFEALEEISLKTYFNVDILNVGKKLALGINPLQLTKLHLEFADARDDGIDLICKMFLNIRDFSIKCGSRELSARITQDISRLINLEKLVIYANWDWETKVGMEFLENFPKLRKMDFDFNIFAKNANNKSIEKICPLLQEITISLNENLISKSLLDCLYRLKILKYMKIFISDYLMSEHKAIFEENVQMFKTKFSIDYDDDDSERWFFQKYTFTKL